jgi:predicted dehydrogenase
MPRRNSPPTHRLCRTRLNNYQNYESMRENPDIDAVYVVLPNALHAEYAIRAAQRGKHVLCEKPMAVSSKECEQMIAACKTAERKLMIAYRIQYEPSNRIVQSYVRSEKFGRVSLIESVNTQNQGDPNQWRQKRFGRRRLVARCRSLLSQHNSLLA